MTRSYARWVRPEGVLVPRGVVVAVVACGLIWMSLRIFVAPSWIVQRLDSPDGGRSAQLRRARYLGEHFVIRVKEGRLWQTVFFGERITNDNRVDLGERLAWSEDSSRLYFRLQGRPVWGYDFARDRFLGSDELATAPP